MRKENQKARQIHIIEEFEKIRNSVIALRDSDIGAEIIASNELAQRIIDYDWDMDKLTRKDLTILRGAIAGLRAQIADAKHNQYETNRNRFQELYNILWRKYGNLKQWQLSYEGNGAVFRYHAVELKFGYDRTSFVTCIVVMKYLSENSSKFEAAVQEKAKRGVTTPSTNLEIALKKVGNEWLIKILGFVGLKPTDLS